MFTVDFRPLRSGAYNVGGVDPAHAGINAVLREIRHAIEDMPDRRLSSPPETAMGQAGMLARLFDQLLPANRVLSYQQGS